MGFRREQRHFGLTWLLVSLVCLTLALLAACGESDVVLNPSPAASAPSTPAEASDATSPDYARWSVPVLRSALKAALSSGRDGEPSAPTSVTRALKRYFASVDPAADFNGASQVRFVWAFTVAPQHGMFESTSTEQYVDVYFWADGEDMVAAGAIAPGFSSHLMRLSRPSSAEVWHVDGLYTP